MIGMPGFCNTRGSRPAAAGCRAVAGSVARLVVIMACRSTQSFLDLCNSLEEAGAFNGHLCSGEPSEVVRQQAGDEREPLHEGEPIQIPMRSEEQECVPSPTESPSRKVVEEEATEEAQEFGWCEAMEMAWYGAMEQEAQEVEEEVEGAEETREEAQEVQYEEDESEFEPGHSWAVAPPPPPVHYWAVAPDTHGRSTNLPADDVARLRHEQQAAARAKIKWQQRGPAGPEVGGPEHWRGQPYRRGVNGG